VASLSTASLTKGGTPTKGDTPTKGASSTPAAIVKLSPEAQALIEKGAATFPEVIEREAKAATADFQQGREALQSTAEALRDEVKAAGGSPSDVMEKINGSRRRLAAAHAKRRARI
jgi:hypothetical protein